LQISWKNDNGDNINLDVTSNNILIALSTDDYDTTSPIIKTDMTSLTHSWSSLISGNIYKIKINAVNSIGSSEYSSDQYVTIASVPDPVSGLTKVSLSSTSITIKYDIRSNNN
jgi:hypothetical protein